MLLEDGYRVNTNAQEIGSVKAYRYQYIEMSGKEVAVVDLFSYSDLSIFVSNRRYTSSSRLASLK